MCAPALHNCVGVTSASKSSAPEFCSATCVLQGYNDGQDIAHTLVPKAAGWGASAITLHGRTREQRYSK